MTSPTPARLETVPAATESPGIDAPARRATDALPLPLLRPGQPARVERVLSAGPGMARKLSAMGLLPGVLVTVLNAQCGPLLLRVGDTRFAIGRGMAQRILVTPCG